MIIKTITCHDVYNFGASLQAYALINYLERQGHNVEIINYKPDYLCQRYKMGYIGPRWKDKNDLVKLTYLSAKFPGRLLERWGRRKFDAFKRKYLKITKQTYRCNDELKKNPPEADAYIAGSDQIWNTLYNNGRDPAFYLDFAPEETVKISYAASFSTSKIMPKYESFVKSMINKLDFISVREIEGLNILNSLEIHTGTHVLDPVFLLSKKSWDQIAYKRIEGKYILVCDFEGIPRIEEFVKNLSKIKNLKIYAINGYIKTPYADIDFIHTGPETFLSLIKHAECIVSNSFHATAFSMIYEKDFFVFKRVKQKVNSRMRDLLTICNLNDRLLDTDIKMGETYERINYKLVKLELEKYIKQSKSFLKTSLNQTKRVPPPEGLPQAACNQDTTFRYTLNISASLHLLATCRNRIMFF